MKVLAFDIETGSVEEMFSFGPGYVRLCGWVDVTTPDNVRISTDPKELVAALHSANAITAHNGINFDLMALAAEGYIDWDEYEALCRKTFDTLIYAKHLDPVAARGQQPDGYYQLGACATHYGLDGKDTVDFDGKIAIIRRIQGDKKADAKVKSRESAARRKRAKGEEPTPFKPVSVLKVLKEIYGGYDKIPLDDPDYVRYLIKDVRAQAGLFLALNREIRDHPETSRRYVRREHYTGIAMGRVTLEGVRADVDETMRRWAAGQARLEAHKADLHARFGMPTEGSAPHRSNPGKAAFRAAILSTGISQAAIEANWPHCSDGSLKTGKDVLEELIPKFEKANPAAADICKTIMAMNGERTVYATILDAIVGDRVHPYIGPDQSSGRWSMRRPGLTVLGKRGGKARERAVILPDNDDEVLVAIDADQVDARVIAAECQDPEYMRLFAPGMDLHSEVAYRVWSNLAVHGAKCHTSATPDCCSTAVKCHCDKRDKAKVFGHGFSYGLGANNMSAMHGVPVEVAEEFVRGMTEAFPRLAEWKAEVRAAAGALGRGEAVPANDTYRILHTWAGRPVRVDRNRAFTQATALIGQGGTRDVMAEAILRLPPEYRRRVRAVIHDEIVLSLPKADAQKVAQGITDSMAFTLKGVEITFGCSDVGCCWAACYGSEYCDHEPPVLAA